MIIIVFRLNIVFSMTMNATSFATNVLIPHNYGACSDEQSSDEDDVDLSNLSREQLTLRSLKFRVTVKMNRHLRQKCKKREMYTNDQPAETTFKMPWYKQNRLK